MTKRFTGRHMLAIMIAFFGTIVAVNLTMASFATRTFGGTVVDNSYVAGQKFNGWLAAARTQEKLGWQTQVALDAERHVIVAVSKDEQTVAGVIATGTARHPLGREADIALSFRMGDQGVLQSDKPLPAGRWMLHLDLSRGADTSRLIEDVI